MCCSFECMEPAGCSRQTAVSGQEFWEEGGWECLRVPSFGAQPGLRQMPLRSTPACWLGIPIRGTAYGPRCHAQVPRACRCSVQVDGHALVGVHAASTWTAAPLAGHAVLRRTTMPLAGHAVLRCPGCPRPPGRRWPSFLAATCSARPSRCGPQSAVAGRPAPHEPQLNQGCLGARESSRHKGLTPVTTDHACICSARATDLTCLLNSSYFSTCEWGLRYARQVPTLVHLHAMWPTSPSQAHQHTLRP